MKKIIILTTLTLLVGCASTGSGEGGSSYRGSGKIVSIVINGEGHQEIGLINDVGEHISVTLKEPNHDLFPDEEVRVNRRANGFGTVNR